MASVPLPSSAVPTNPASTTNGVRSRVTGGAADEYYNDTSASTIVTASTPASISTIPSRPSYMASISQPHAAPPVVALSSGMYTSPLPLHSPAEFPFPPSQGHPQPQAQVQQEEETHQNPDYHDDDFTIPPPPPATSVAVVVPPPSLNGHIQPTQIIHHENPEYHSHIPVHHSYDGKNSLVQPPALKISLQNLYAAYARADREEVAKFEAFSIASGICKRCFPKGSSGAGGLPRKHNYKGPSTRRRVYYVGKYRRIRFLALKRRSEEDGGGMHFHWWDDTEDSSVESITSSSGTSDGISSGEGPAGSEGERKKLWKLQDQAERKMMKHEMKKIERDQRREARYRHNHQQTQASSSSPPHEHSSQRGIFGSTGAAATSMWRRNKEFWLTREGLETSSSSGGEDSGEDNGKQPHRVGRHRGGRVDITNTGPGGLFEPSSPQENGEKGHPHDLFYDPGYSGKGKGAYEPSYYDPSKPSSSSHNDRRGGGAAGAGNSPIVMMVREAQGRGASTTQQDRGLFGGGSSSYAAARSSPPPSTHKQYKVTKRQNTRPPSFDDGLAYGGSPRSSSPASSHGAAARPRRKRSWLFGRSKKKAPVVDLGKKNASLSSFDENLAYGAGLSSSSPTDGSPRSTPSPGAPMSPVPVESIGMHHYNGSQATWETLSLNSQGRRSVAESFTSSFKGARRSIGRTFGGYAFGQTNGDVEDAPGKIRRSRSGKGGQVKSPWRWFSKEINQTAIPSPSASPDSYHHHNNTTHTPTGEEGRVVPSAAYNKAATSRLGEPNALNNNFGSTSSRGSRRHSGSVHSDSSGGSRQRRRDPSHHSHQIRRGNHRRTPSNGSSIVYGSDRRSPSPPSKKKKSTGSRIWKYISSSVGGGDRNGNDGSKPGEWPGGEESVEAKKEQKHKSQKAREQETNGEKKKKHRRKKSPEKPLEYVFPKASADDPNSFGYVHITPPTSANTAAAAHRNDIKSQQSRSGPGPDISYSNNEIIPIPMPKLPPPATALSPSTPSPVYPMQPQMQIRGLQRRPTYELSEVPPLPPMPPQSHNNYAKPLATIDSAYGGSTRTGPASVVSSSWSPSQSAASTITGITAPSMAGKSVRSPSFSSSTGGGVGGYYSSPPPSHSIPHALQQLPSPTTTDMDLTALPIHTEPNSTIPSASLNFDTPTGDPRFSSMWAIPPASALASGGIFSTTQRSAPPPPPSQQQKQQQQSQPQISMRGEPTGPVHQFRSQSEKPVILDQRGFEEQLRSLPGRKVAVDEAEEQRRRAQEERESQERQRKFAQFEAQQNAQAKRLKVQREQAAREIEADRQRQAKIDADAAAAAAAAAAAEAKEQDRLRQIEEDRIRKEAELQRLLALQRQQQQQQQEEQRAREEERNRDLERKRAIEAEKVERAARAERERKAEEERLAAISRQRAEEERHAAIVRQRAEEDERLRKVEEERQEQLREAERQEAQRREEERQEALKREAALKEAERQDALRKEAERQEVLRVAAQREAERQDALRRAERIEAERREAERLEALKREAERAEAEKREVARKEAERQEALRQEALRVEALRVEAERQERLRYEAEQEAKRKEAAHQEELRRETERLEALRLEALRLEAEQQEARRLEATRLEAARQAARLEAARLEAARLEAARLEAARLEAARLEEARLEAERREAERLEALRFEAEQEKKRREAEHQEQLRREAEHQAALQREAEKQETLRQEALQREAEEREVQRQEALRRELEQQEAIRQEALRKEEEERQLALQREYAIKLAEHQRIQAQEKAEALAREKAELEAIRLEQIRVQEEQRQIEQAKAEALAREEERKKREDAEIAQRLLEAELERERLAAIARQEAEEKARREEEEREILRKQEEEEALRREAERKAFEEQEALRIAAKLAAEAAENLRKAEEAQKLEAERLEQERLELEQKKEAERQAEEARQVELKRQAEMARLEAERIEKERLEKERAAWEKYEAEQARIRREEAERAEAFRQQQLRREEEERLALERARLEEEERARQEKQQKEEQERIRREEAERAEALRQQQLQREEELLALEKARLEEEEQARREQQRKEEEEKIRRQKEDEEKEALRQQQQREEEERIALERVRVEEEERACQEQEQKQKEEQERLAALEVLRLEEEEKEKERVAAEVAAAAEAERFEAWQQQQRELERLRAEEEERMERDLALEQERIHAEHQAQLEAMRLEEDRLAEERRAEQEAEEARRAAEQQAAAEAAEREAAEELARRATAEEQARGLAAEKRAREEEARIAAEEELRKQEALHAEQAAAAARVAEELAREEAENASRVAEMQRKLEALMEQHRKQTEEAAAAAAATVITAHSDQEQTSRSADTAPIERGRDTAPASLDRSPAADADRERSLQGEPDEERAERRRARSLIRQSREASPEYREETRRRSRDREREREKERKAEVENMRRILGLDDTTPDTTLDDEAPPPPPPNLSDLIDDDDEDEDGNNNPPETTVLVTVPEISNWVAPWPIPRLVEIVPTPRPGKERPPAKVFVDGTGFSQEAESEDYFNYSHVVVDASPAAPEVNAELVRSEPDHEAFNFTIPPPPPDASNDLWSEPSSPIEEYMPEFPIVQTDSISVPEIIALPDTSDGVTEEPAASPTQIALPAENDEDVYRELAPLVTLFPVPVTQNDTQETISEGISRGDHTLASENDLPPTTASTIAEISSSPPSAESTPIISEEISTNTSVVEEAKSSPSLHSADINHPESPIENVETSILNAAVTRGQEESAAYLPTEIALPESPIEKAEVSANATDIQGVDISFPEVIPFPVDVALPASPIEQHEKPSEKTATISEPTNIVKSEAAQASSSIPPAVQHINPDYWVDAAESPVHGIPVKNREAVPEMVSENIIPPAEITINESTIISHVNPDYWKDDADAAIPVSDHIDVQGDVEVEKNMEDRETEQPVPAPNDVDIDPNPQIQESEHIVEVEQEGTNTVTSKPADFDQASPTGDFEFVQDTRSDSPKPEYASLPGTPGDMTPPELINAARLSRPRSFESPEDAEEISHDAVRGVEQDAEFMALLTAVAEASGFETRDVLDHRVNVEEEPLSPPPVPTSLRRGSQIPFVEEVADEEQGGALTPQYRALPPKEDWTIPSQFPALSKLQKKTSPTMAAATDDISARLIDYPSNSSASRRASISGAYTSGQITPSDLTPNPSPPGTVAARIRRAVTNPHPPSSDSGIGDDEQSRVSSMMPSSSYADGMRNYSPPPSINWKNGDQDNGISVDHNERRLRRRQEREIPFGAVLNRAASMDALGKRPASAFQDKLKFWNNSAGPDEIVAPVTINRTRSTSPINAGPQIRKGLFDQPPMPFTEQPPKSLKRSQTWAALRRKSSTPEIDAVSPQLNFSPPIAEAKAIPEPEKATSPSSPPPSNQEQLSKLVASRGVSQTPSPSPLDTVGFPYHVPADANSWGRKLGKFFEYPFPAQKQISPQSSLRFEDLDIDEGDADETLVGEQGDSSVQIIADVANTVAPLEKSPEVEVQDISQVESTFTEIELPQQNSSNEIISSVPDVTEDSTELNAPPPAGRRRKGKKRKSIPSMNQQNTVSEIEAAAIPLPAEEETLTELLPEAQVEVPVEKPSVDDQVPEEAATTTPQEQQADEVLLPAESTEVSEAPIVAQALEPVIIPRRNIEDEARSAPTSSWSDYFSINKGKGKETEVQETSRSLSSEAAEGNSPVVVEAPLTETPIWVPLPEDEQGQSPVDERPSSPIRVDDVNSSEVQITEEEVSDDDDEDTEPLPTMPLSPILEEAADSDEELQPEAHPAPEYVPFSLESIPEEDDEDYEDNYDVPTATEIAQEDIWHADPIPADGDLGLYLQQLHGDGIDVPQRPISSASSTRRRKRRKRRSLGDINNQEENTLDEPLAKAEDKEEMAPEGNNRSQDEQAQHNTQEEKQEDKAQVNVMEEIREVQLDTTEDKSLDKEADVVPLDTTDASQTAEVASEERFIDKYVPEDNQVRSEAANEDTVEEGAKATEDIFTEPSNTQDTAHEVFSSHEAVSEAQGASTQPLPEQVQQAAPPEAPKVPKLKRFLGMALKAKKAEAEKLNSPTSGPNSPQSTTQSSIQGERKLPRRVPKLAQISDELSLWMKADKKMGQSPLKFNHVTQSEPSLVSPSSSRLPRLNSSLGPSTDDASPQSQTHSPVYSENDTPQLHSRPSFSQLPRLKRTSTEPVLPMAHNLPIKHYPATTDDIPDFPSRIPRVPSQTIRLVDPEPDELGAPTPNRFGFRRSPSIASLTPSITEEPKPVSVPITSIASASTASLEKVADSGASTSSAGSSSSKSFGFLKAAKKFSFKKSKKVKPADQATPEYEQQQPVYPESRPISDSMSGESQDEKERQRALAGVRRRDPEEMSLPSSASSARSTNFPTPSGMRESFIMPFAESWTEVQKESPRMSATPEELGSSAIAAMELPISAVVEQLEAAKEEQVPESQNDSHGPDNGPREHEADQQSAAARDVGSAPSVNSPAAPIATPVHADAGAGEDAPRQSLSQPAPRNHVDKSHNIPSAAEESVHTISTSTSTSAPSLAALDDAVAVEAQSLDRSDGIHAGAFPGTPEGEAPAARPAKLARSRSGKGKKRASATNEDTPEASTSVAPKEGAQNATSVESAAEEINVANPEIEPAAVVEPIADLPTIPEDAPLTEAVESPEAPILQRSLSKRKTNRRTSIDSIATLDEDDQGDSDDDDDNDTLNNSRTHTRSGSPTPSEFSIGGEEGGLKRSGSKKKKRKNKSGSQRRKESRLKRASLTGLAEASKEAEAQAKAQSESQPAPQPVATPSAPVKKPSITELVRAKTAALKASNPELLSKSGASGSGAESKEQQGWTEKGNSSPISTKAQHRQSSLQALSGSSDPLLKAVDSESQEASLASTAEEGSQSATSGDQAREGIPEPQQSNTDTTGEDEEDEESDEEDKNEEENGRNQGKDKEDDKDEEGAPPSQQPPSSSVRSIFGPHEDEQPNQNNKNHKTSGGGNSNNNQYSQSSPDEGPTLDITYQGSDSYDVQIQILDSPGSDDSVESLGLSVWADLKSQITTSPPAFTHQLSQDSLITDGSPSFKDERFDSPSPPREQIKRFKPPTTDYFSVVLNPAPEQTVVEALPVHNIIPDQSEQLPSSTASTSSSEGSTRSIIGPGTVLSTIHERSEEGSSDVGSSIERPSTAPPQSSSPSELLPRPRLPPNPLADPIPGLTRRNTDGGFLSSADLLNRLFLPPGAAIKPIERSKTVGPSSQPPPLSRTNSYRLREMNTLRRSDRADSRRSPSLKAASLRSGGSPRPASEHIIFGGDDDDRRRSWVDTTTSRDVFEALGDREEENKSPHKPPSIRRKQSLHILDLEDQVGKLSMENTGLEHEKAKLVEEVNRYKSKALVLDESLNKHKDALAKRDRELRELKQNVEFYKAEVARLSEANDSLGQTNSTLTTAFKMDMANINKKHDRKREQLIQLSKEHSVLQKQYSDLQGGMEKIIRQEIDAALQEKDIEVDKLKDELTKARGMVRKLQKEAITAASTAAEQINQATKAGKAEVNKYITVKSDEYFPTAFQNLAKSIHAWCTKFSRQSERSCLSLHRITDDWVRDRIEVVMLDDTAVRRLLKDKSRRQDALAAIVMRMIREGVFTRYLFGLAGDERQKLNSLERHLGEIGPAAAVNLWRATTLTLLSQRATFQERRASEAAGVMKDIIRALSGILPQPTQLPTGLLDELNAIIAQAVQLSIEMRTQRAQYMVPAPPNPEYDDDGDNVTTIPFNSKTMSIARVAADTTNSSIPEEELEREPALVKLVMVPLVLRFGNNEGEDYEKETVVLPMQVLVTSKNEPVTTSFPQPRQITQSLPQPGKLQRAATIRAEPNPPAASDLRPRIRRAETSGAAGSLGPSERDVRREREREREKERERERGDRDNRDTRTKSLIADDSLAGRMSKTLSPVPEASPESSRTVRRSSMAGGQQAPPPQMQFSRDRDGRERDRDRDREGGNRRSSLLAK